MFALAAGYLRQASGLERALSHLNGVELRLPDARSPEGDARLLGVALVSMKIYVTDS